MADYTNKLKTANAEWANEMRSLDPDYFTELSKGQSPKALWIGCADSRVPPSITVKGSPGDIFVHRNVANLVVQTDINLMSVLQYSVEVLKVEHVIVCGHTGCGGVRASLGEDQFGLIDYWIQQIRDTQETYHEALKNLEGLTKENKLIDLNVIEQVYNLSKTDIIKNAWASGRSPQLHGWVFDLTSGLILEQTGGITDATMIREVRNRAMKG